MIIHAPKPPPFSAALVDPPLPLHCDWHSSGTLAAMARLLKWVNALPTGRCPLGATSIPDWFYEPDLELTTHHLIDPTDRIHALLIVRSIRCVRVQLDAMAEGKQAQPPGGDVFDASAEPDGMKTLDARQLSAYCRLALGEMLEAAARAWALELCSVDEIPGPTLSGARRRTARVFSDSFLVAVWTSAHAEYLQQIQCALDMMPDGATSFDIQPPPPSPLIVPHSIMSLPDLHLLLDRKLPATTSKVHAGKQAAAMAQLLGRCSNASARGWETLLSETVTDGSGPVRICRLSTLSTLTGMHPCLHPASRPVWETRAKIQRVTDAAGDTKRLVCASPTVARESVRLYLAAILSNTPATREALAAAGHTSGLLSLPPYDLPNPSLLSAMTKLADVGAGLLSAASFGEMFESLIGSLVDESTPSATTAAKGSKRQKRTPTRALAGGLSVSYTTSWLGRSHPPFPKRPPLIDEVSSLVFSVYRADFLPLWRAAWETGARLGRLDTVQHAILHRRNAAQQLVDELTDDRRLYIQRCALRCTRAALLPLADVAQLLGWQPRLESSVKIADVPVARLASELLYFAKVASLKDNIISWDLGTTTRNAQIRALARRQLLDVSASPTTEQIVAALPVASTHLLVCVECRRVANACCDRTGKLVACNEIGTSSSMLKIDGDVLCGHMRCAKRSSAALRTALQLEEDARNAMLNSDAQVSSALVSYDDAAVLAKLRRDVKATYEQTGSAVSCGDQPLVTVKVLGRVIKIFGTTYSLCGICGVLTLVAQENRFHGEICCQRCDAEMLTRSRPEAIDAFKAAVAPLGVARRCRFCGKQDTSTVEASKWKRMAAPLDGDGLNASVPPPLRSVIYCPKHWKPWLAQAHTSLDTRVIFSHLTGEDTPAHRRLHSVFLTPLVVCCSAAKARPVVGANTSGRGFDSVDATDAFAVGSAAPVAEPSKPRKQQRRVRSLKHKG